RRWGIGGRPAVPARWRRRGDLQLADETQQIGALQPKRARRVRAVAARLLQRGFDELALEGRDGAVIGDHFATRVRVGEGVHGQRGDATRMPRLHAHNSTPGSRASPTGALRAGRRAQKRRALADATARSSVEPAAEAERQDFVAGFTPGWSLKN